MGDEALRKEVQKLSAKVAQLERQLNELSSSKGLGVIPYSTALIAFAIFLGLCASAVPLNIRSNSNLQPTSPNLSMPFPQATPIDNQHMNLQPQLTFETANIIETPTLQQQPPPPLPKVVTLFLLFDKEVWPSFASFVAASLPNDEGRLYRIEVLNEKEEEEGRREEGNKRISLSQGCNNLISEELSEGITLFIHQVSSSRIEGNYDRRKYEDCLAHSGGNTIFVALQQYQKGGNVGPSTSSIEPESGILLNTPHPHKVHLEFRHFLRTFHPIQEDQHNNHQLALLSQLLLHKKKQVTQSSS